MVDRVGVVTFLNFSIESFLCFILEWRYASQHLEHNNSNSPHITSLPPIALLTHDLGTHIRRRTTEDLQRFLTKCSEAKIDYFNHSRGLLVYKVVKFHVPMTHLHTVHVVEAFDKLSDNMGCELFLKTLASLVQ